MKKNYLTIFVLLVILGLMTGCANKKDQANNKQKNQNQQQVQDNQMPTWNENLEEVNLDDLAVGQRVLAVGTENSDGSLSANRIMIGNSGTDFERMAGLRQPPNDDNDQAEGGGRQLVDRNRPNFEQIQNMSEKERMKFREEMKVRREAGGGRSGRANMGGGMARLSGEIIDKDDTTITIKINEGGSKLIFYSDKTKILKFKTDSKKLKEEGNK